MNRTIAVTIDQNSWPLPPLLPSYPPSFGTTHQSFDINIPALLLLIGQLTTPSHASGVSLSEFWAWVRYLHAMTNDPDLRLTSAFVELDAHQKTILSDDFGMGVSIYWLREKLNLELIVDGRYFIDRVAASVNATAARTQKRGPTKSPDFVARDANGIWHIIECKGTQTAGGYRDTQLARAVTQKRTITFPQTNSGQRLACGLYIGIEGGAHTSSLRIIDPPGTDDFVLSEDRMALAEDAIIRSVSARSLRLAGFSASASAMSAPLGLAPSSRPLKGRREILRKEAVETKRKLAEEELKNRAERQVFTADGKRYRGRQVKIDLPVSAIVDGQSMHSVRIRCGVSVDFLDELREHAISEEPIQEKVNSLQGAGLGMRLTTRGKSARLSIGSSFISEITFYP